MSDQFELSYRRASHRTDSQTQHVLDYLQQGFALTPLEALHRFGSLRLAAIVWTLRDEGHDIITERIALPNGKKVARYSLNRHN